MSHLNYRLYRRVTEIRDGLLALRSYRDPEVRMGSADDREIFELRRANDLTTEAAWLRQIARAYTRSPVA